jgi:hypothetical protein
VAFAGFPYAGQVRTRFAGLLAAARAGEGEADVRVLCLHHCVEGATCGPGDFTFRAGDDVIRAAELPRDFAVVLSGHIHRHQVLRPGDGPEVVYAGSVERTSFAEAGETKGVVIIDLSPGGVAALDFRPLPARPMVVRRLSFRGMAPERIRSHLAQVLEATPPDAVGQLRVEGDLPPAAAALLGAASLRLLRVRLLRGAGLAKRRRRREPTMTPRATPCGNECRRSTTAGRGVAAVARQDEEEVPAQVAGLPDG